MDGFPFDGEPTLVPVAYDHQTATFTYENLQFCSPACAKGWLFRDPHTNTDRIQLLTLYCTTVLGLVDPVQVCPDPRFLCDYMLEPATGLTIEQFRTRTTGLQTGFAHINPVVDQTVYLEPVTETHHPDS